MAPVTHHTSDREHTFDNLAPTGHYKEDPLWDRWVFAMRVGLPVVSVILGAITLSWPFINDREVSFTLSREDVARSDSGIRMTNLRYTGTDAVDRLFVVEASSGTQDDPASPRVRLQDIQAHMDIEDNNQARVAARTGIYRHRDGTLSLVGGVTIETDNGYSLKMAGAEIDLKGHTATGQGQVEGVSPLGTLNAGSMEIRVDEREGIFDGGVHIQITPKRQQNTTPGQEGS
ncbi:hypothetical protein GCM10017044_07770 [Kordiimonas sediminis]|uniref:LPS export ABC transporter periplasmic protein LptC n=1 Tax=Kordiimonas sediminis TaxID=1735581 RepID=A0A919AMR1_9PROT|nr:LPS export ABC transporter periplasmic protein LptC [Kordiimonas sediminis]GHF15962.1 hypothetical protein GCM10017044_07770 [Kordiimonas sediminis]